MPIKSIILDSLKVISPDYIPYFISAYFYDTHTDKGVNIYSFDYSYTELLEEVRGDYPYTLLFSCENGALKKYQSGYDLLGKLRV